MTQEWHDTHCLCCIHCDHCERGHYAPCPHGCNLDHLLPHTGVIIHRHAYHRASRQTQIECTCDALGLERDMIKLRAWMRREHRP